MIPRRLIPIVSAIQIAARRLAGELYYWPGAIYERWRMWGQKPHGVRFWIICTERNAGCDAIACLASLKRQTYRNFSVCYIDDASDDWTPHDIRKMKLDGTDIRFVWHETPTHGGLAPILRELRGEHGPGPDDVVVMVDGDDVLHDGALEWLARVYGDPEVWMTFGNTRDSHGRLKAPYGYSAGVLARGEARTQPWGISHPKTFRRWLLDYVREEALIDPETGQHWQWPNDAPLALPMMELAAGHVLRVWRTIYTWRVHSRNYVALGVQGKTAEVYAHTPGIHAPLHHDPRERPEYYGDDERFSILAFGADNSKGE